MLGRPHGSPASVLSIFVFMEECVQNYHKEIVHFSNLGRYLRWPFDSRTKKYKLRNKTNYKIHLYLCKVMEMKKK